MEIKWKADAKDKGLAGLDSRCANVVIMNVVKAPAAKGELTIFNKKDKE